MKTVRTLALILYVSGAAFAQNATTAGRFTVEHPTLLNPGFEWAISGDDNRNATVSAEYRAVGEAKWREALPLVRIEGERIFRQKEHFDYTVPPGFACSILNLKPGTEYECRFRMSDPGGVSGEASLTVRARTREEPQAYTRSRQLHVYTPDYKGERLAPSFSSVLEAYYGAGPGDWNAVWEQRAKPGKAFATLADLRAATGQEAHGIEVDFDIFAKPGPPNPANRHAVYHAMDLSFELRPGGQAVDAGVRIPAISDDFTGRAPDPGALKVGAPEAKYGPLWLTWQSFYR